MTNGHGQLPNKDGFKSYKPAHTRKELIQLVEKVLGDKVAHIERKDLGEVNAVYFAILGGGTEVVIRVSPKEKVWSAFPQEAWAFQKCRAVGVPTPEVLAVEAKPEDFPEPYMITKRIPGVSGESGGLTEEQKLEVLNQLGHYLRLIHTIKIPGFGWLKPEGQGYRGRFDSLWAFILSFFGPEFSGNRLPEGKLEEFKCRFEDSKDLFDLKEASLVHGDMSLKNVIVEGTKVTGVLDMENVKAHDPIFDFAWLDFWVNGQGPYLEALKRGYGDSAIFSDNFEKRMLLYELTLVISTLRYFEERGFADRIKKMFERIARIESALDSLN